MILYGCGGIGVVALEVAEALGLESIRFLDDQTGVGEFRGYPVRPGVETQPELSIAASEQIAICIGNNTRRASLAKRFAAQLASLVSPFTILSPTATIGEGTLVFSGSVVQAGAVIGRAVILNTGASIDHECVIEDHVHIAPNTTLCGYVNVKEGANVGAASTAIPGITIGRWSTVGAGTVLIKDVPDHATVVGVPGRIVG